MNIKEILKKFFKGFTIIEILVVVAVVALIAAISLAFVSQFSAKGRDARRRADLESIAKGLNLYYYKVGNWVETGSGCGANGNGSGWFNLISSGSYPKSISQCLVEAGSLPSEVIDPSKSTTCTPTSRFAYMKYNCGTGSSAQVYLYAKLETLPQNATATDGTCCPNCDTSYGMNYVFKVK